MLVDPAPLSMIRELQMPGLPDPVEEILELFRQDALDVGRMLHDAAAAGDMEGVRRAAHRLKGASVNLGCTALTAHLTVLEDDARAGLHEAVRSGVAAVPGLAERTLAALYALP